MHVVILAAGKGNRLAHITKETPKPLIPILGKTILGRIIESLPPAITQILVVTQHLEEQIHAFCAAHPRARDIVCISQGEMTGTYGALKSAEAELSSPFLVVNGDDIHSQKDLSNLISLPRGYGVAKHKSHGYYAIDRDAQGNFSGMHSQTPEEKEEGVFIATGAYVLDADFFKLDPVLTRENEYGIPQTLRAAIGTYPTPLVDMPDWVPINTPEDLKEAEKAVVTL